MICPNCGASGKEITVAKFDVELTASQMGDPTRRAYSQCCCKNCGHGFTSNEKESPPATESLNDDRP